ncbi:Hypothetical protein R9X50_00694400 [Acrodontium crateriforme]|uniref:Small ribosomal subunit protein uS3m n=1 Tax=Acrodontium crateriforme TaxID=150365 RepID=A0AAQ3MA52_9PEZI|nr:Hypothetical protein R9X50_00694400 [Acrodontium crateriforme]
MAAAPARRAVGKSLNLTDPKHAAGLASILTKLYKKPVELNLIELRRPHLNSEILSSVVAEQLRDRRNAPRKAIRDAAWKAPLPTPRAVTALIQAKLASPTTVTSRALQRSSAWGRHRIDSSSILRSLKLSQVSSIRVQAAGRLSKRLTANQAEKKAARRGANAKGPGFMLRGFKKAHVASTVRAGKRRIGSFGIKVDLGHS